MIVAITVAGIVCNPIYSNAIEKLEIQQSQNSTNLRTAQDDHRELLKQLGISQLRPGKDGMNPNSPNFANVDESKASPYSGLPEIMKFNNGKPLKSAADWRKRRQEILDLFDQEIYGVTPKNLPKVTWKVMRSDVSEIAGIPVSMQDLQGDIDASQFPSIPVSIRSSLVLPLNKKGAPVVIEFGFSMGGGGGLPNASSWQAKLLKEGWGYAILQPNSYQADNGGGLTQGIIGHINKGKPRSPQDWGTLKAWGWGASRLLDHFGTDPRIDAKKVAIEGLSRYGKAAAVTMAYDERFSIGFIGSSGQGGVKLMRRDFGETVENVASSGEYHWMGGRYVRYAGPLKPSDCPVDAHMLVALCAPRPTFVGVGSLKVEGIWIDPVGTYLATQLASPAYKLLGKKGLTLNRMPEEGTPDMAGELAFSQHTGGHTNGPNWDNFISFARRYWN